MNNDKIYRAARFVSAMFEYISRRDKEFSERCEGEYQTVIKLILANENDGGANYRNYVERMARR
jgi:hypothetical protein